MTAGVEDELRSVVRRCLTGAADSRQFMSGDSDEAKIDLELWGRLGHEVGVAGIIAPVELGGSGGRFADLTAVLSEAGAALAAVPALSTAGFAAPILSLLSTPAADETLRAIAESAMTATVGWPGPGDVRQDGDRLTGVVRFVIDGMSSDAILVVVDDHVWRIDPADVVRQPMKTLDLTRGMAVVTLDRSVAKGLGPATDGVTALPLVALAAEQVGLAARILDDAVHYAKERTQFGRPIGSFQSVKHKLADLSLEVEIGRALLSEAVEASDEYLRDRSLEHELVLSTAAFTAAGHCGEMATHVAKESLHVFGGIGFTWEHHAHLYYRRAKTDEVLLDHPVNHRRRLARRLGLTAVGSAQLSPRS